MKVDAERIARLRKERSWSQDELAVASGLNLRTVQRVEKDGTASLQTKKALAAALDLDARDLGQEEIRMKPCSVCGSDEIYQYDDFFFRPKLAGPQNTGNASRPERVGQSAPARRAGGVKASATRYTQQSRVDGRRIQFS